MKVVTIKQALQYVSDNPDFDTDAMLEMRAYELIGRTLFDIANGVRSNNPTSFNRANVARELIFTRLIGRRHAGTHPARATTNTLKLVDLTSHQLEK